MDDTEWLAERFETHRGHLRSVAYRMLGSGPEADDAVQEAWLRLSRSNTNDVENLAGWLTTVVARICLDMLRSRTSRREEPLESTSLASAEGRGPGFDPEAEAELADTIGPALLVVLDTLAPAERLAFVLHDMFGVPFDDIAPIVGRSPAAARQLASRARRRVQGARPDAGGGGDRQRAVIEAFLAASRDGDFDELLAVLDPDVVLRADQVAVDLAASRRVSGAPPLSDLVRGRDVVARTFAGRAAAARPALVDGAFGAVWAPDGRVRSVFRFTITGGRIAEIEIVADPIAVQQLDVAVTP